MHFVQGTGRVGSLFVEALVTETASEKDAQVWQSILRNLFSNLGEMSFTEPITALESKLFALDVFLRSPMLQRLLVSCNSVSHSWSAHLTHCQIAGWLVLTITILSLEKQKQVEKIV